MAFKLPEEPDVMDLMTKSSMEEEVVVDPNFDHLTSHPKIASGVVAVSPLPCPSHHLDPIPTSRQNYHHHHLYYIR